MPSRLEPWTLTQAHLAGGVEAGDDVGVVAQHLGLDVGRHAAHGVVRGRVDRHRLGVGLHAEVGAGELGDVRQLGVDVRRLEVGQVEQHVVLVRAGAAALTHLVGHRAGDDVARREVLDGGGVALHEPLAVGVAQDAALAAGGLGQQDAQPGQAGRVELEELHVLQRQAAAEGDAHAVTGEGVGVGGGLEDLAGAAGGQDDGLGPEDVDLAGGQLVGHDAGGALVAERARRHQQVEDVELVEELHALLDAVLVERLQDHVAGAVGGVAGAADRGLTVVAGVAAEPALVDLALGRAVERQAHLLEVDDRVDGLAAHDLGGVLVDEVVAALDGVEGVPLPVVLLDVGEGGAHAALGRAGVGPGGVELGEDGGAHAGRGLERGAHARPARADDDDVVLVCLHGVQNLSGVTAPCTATASRRGRCTGRT